MSLSYTWVSIINVHPCPTLAHIPATHAEEDHGDDGLGWFRDV